MLSPEEHARAARFVRPEDAGAFVFRRAFLRSVLGSCLDRDPGSLRFATTPNGRPRLRCEDPAEALDFSSSHSDGLALCAIGQGPVGIDIEQVRPGVDWQPIARQFFSRGERRLIEERGAHAFFTAWTLKEALIKASGRTLADLPRLDVAGALSSGRADHDGLSLRTVSVRTGYAAALAAPMTVTSVGLRWWTSSPAARPIARCQPPDRTSEVAVGR